MKKILAFTATLIGILTATAYAVGPTLTIVNLNKNKVQIKVDLGGATCTNYGIANYGKSTSCTHILYNKQHFELTVYDNIYQLKHNECNIKLVKIYKNKTIYIIGHIRKQPGAKHCIITDVDPRKSKHTLIH